MSLVLPDRAPVDRFRLLPPWQRAAFFAQLRPGVLSDVDDDWEGFWARPEQIIAPEDLERYGLIVITGGRREGKTRAAVQLFIREVDEGRAVHPRVFAAIEADVDAAVMHGLSGIITHLSEEQRTRWRWIADEGPAGTVRVVNKRGDLVKIRCFTAASPEGAVSHGGDLDLYDDVAKWGPHAVTAWAHARLSCAHGYACGIVATTRRGTRLLKKLLEGRLDGVLIRRLGLGSNAGNLAAKWRQNARAELAEVAGGIVHEDLDDEDIAAGSPFGELHFDRAPIRIAEVRREDLDDVIVAVDPAEGDSPQHDEWGIVAAGRRRDRHVIVLEDGSGRLSEDPKKGAGARVLELARRWGARRIVCENNRGPRALATIRAAHLQHELDRTTAGDKRPWPLPELVTLKAEKSKRERAGPVRTLYLSGLLHHLAGLDGLEAQQRQWDPPALEADREKVRRPGVDDRIDALMHAAHHLAHLGDKRRDPRGAFEGLKEANEGWSPNPGLDPWGGAGGEMG